MRGPTLGLGEDVISPKFQVNVIYGKAFKLHGKKTTADKYLTSFYCNSKRPEYNTYMSYNFIREHVLMYKFCKEKRMKTLTTSRNRKIDVTTDFLNNIVWINN